MRYVWNISGFSMPSISLNTLWFQIAVESSRDEEGSYQYVWIIHCFKVRGHHLASRTTTSYKNQFLEQFSKGKRVLYRRFCIESMIKDPTFSFDPTLSQRDAPFKVCQRKRERGVKFLSAFREWDEKNTDSAPPCSPPLLGPSVGGQCSSGTSFKQAAFLSFVAQIPACISKWQRG